MICSLLNKKAVHDLWVLKWQTLSIIVVVGIGVSLLSGVDMAFKSLVHTRDRFYQEYHFSDIELLFIPTDKEMLPDFSDIQGISKIEKRLLFPGTIHLQNGKKLSGILVQQETLTPSINSFKVLEGKLPAEGDNDGVVIERSLARYHGYAPGDTIKIQVGNKVYDNHITGVVATPEFMTGVSNPDFFAPGKGTLGVLFGNNSRNKDVLGFTLINDLLFTFSSGTDPKGIKKQIMEHTQGRLALEKIIPREEHFSYKYMDLDLKGFKLYVPTLNMIMGLLSFIITFAIYDRLIINQRKEIATLLCMGYRRKEVLSSYLLGASLLGISGVILGLGISLIVRNIFAYVQYMALDLPVLYNQIYADSLVHGALFGVTITIIPPLFILSQLLKLSPHELLREPVQEHTIQKKMLSFVSDTLSFLNMEYGYTVRNLIRQKWLTASTVACIGLSLGVAISYISSVGSINKTIIESNNYEKWDLCVDFLYPAYRDDSQKIAEIFGVAAGEPFIRKFVEVGYRNRYKDTNMLGVMSGTTMKQVKLIEGHWLSDNAKNEIILNQDIAGNIGAHINDQVDIKIDGNHYLLKVVGITAQFSVGQSIMHFSQAQRVFDLPDESTGIFLKVTHTDRLSAIKNELQQLEYVGRVTEKNVMRDEILRQMHELMGIVDISTFFSIIVSLVFMYTSTALALFERKGEFALLKSLGYSKISIRKIVFSQVLIQGVAGCLLSIPVAISITILLNHRLSIAWYRIHNYFGATDFAGIIIASIILMPVMAVPSMRFIHNLDMSIVLRQKSIE